MKFLISSSLIAYFAIALWSPTLVVSWTSSSSSKSSSATSSSIIRSSRGGDGSLQASSTSTSTETSSSNSISTTSKDNVKDIFEQFVLFLQEKQTEIIQQVESVDGGSSTSSKSKFTYDTWGLFDPIESQTNVASGGITRVIQGGNVVEKGACSLTLIRKGILTAERAAAIRSRQQSGDDNNNNTPTIQAGDSYSAAALSIVFHTRSPYIPTFRSDVRIFLVESSSSPDETIAFFGGGADLTPYYLFDEDITFFHTMYRDLCVSTQESCSQSAEEAAEASLFSYPTLKKSCDDYFYLPARSEHRGTGGIFFDDLPASIPQAKEFVETVANTWMSSWLPIVEKRRKLRFTDKEKQWQLLRRGRYLEFNLLYDRGVKFGLANANPRVEGVMVSAPPVIAFEYNHEIKEGSEEARLMEILKTPKDWV